MQEKIPQSDKLQRLNTALTEAFLKLGIKRKWEMAEYLGYKNPYFSGITNGRDKITDAFLNNISARIGVSKQWIETGTGEMMLGEKKKQEPTGWNVPLLPIYAHGGTLSLFSQRVNGMDCEKICSPMAGIDFAITVSGDSMSPEYPNGSIVLIKKIDENAFIEWGKAYVLDTRNGIVIKTLVPGEKVSGVRCLSINHDPIFAPFEVSFDDIYGIYSIMFCMTRK